MSAGSGSRPRRFRRTVAWAALIAALVVIIAVAGAVIYADLATAEPEPAALEALPSTPEAARHDGWLVFAPVTGTAQTGLIFYPGGLVDPRAYAPAARAIAEQGYLVVVVPMPLNLAVFGANRASQVIAAFPDIEQWAIGGHSLGGAMAAQYACDHPGAIQALVLWAAYPPEGCDLSASGLAVTSIYGTNDGLVSAAEMDAAREQLPPNAAFVAIEGGNHAQFGRYGAQKGDRVPTLTPETQQDQAVTATTSLLAQMGAQGMQLPIISLW